MARRIWLGRFFCFRFCGRGKLRVGIDEGIIERGCERVRFSLVGKLSEQEFIAETVRMNSASKKNEEPGYYCIGVDNDSVPHGYVRYDGGAKLSAIVVDTGVDGVKNSYVQACSLRQYVKRIRVRMTKTRLHVKRENRSHRDTERFNNETRNLGESTC